MAVFTVVSICIGSVMSSGSSATPATLFSSVRNADGGAASYVALESFEGSLNGVSGSFNFVHAASTHGEDRYGDFFSIVDASGTNGLTGISGSGGMTVDPDGTHRVWFDYTLGD